MSFIKYLHALLIFLSWINKFIKTINIFDHVIWYDMFYTDFKYIMEFLFEDWDKELSNKVFIELTDHYELALVPINEEH